MIPLMTSRFRRGFTPRRFFGIAASIAASCSSVNQNRFDIVAPSVGTLRIEPDGVRSSGNWVSTLGRSNRSNKRLNLSSQPTTRSMVSKRSLNMTALNNGFLPRLVNFLPLGLALILGTMPRLKIAFRFCLQS